MPIAYGYCEIPVIKIFNNYVAHSLYIAQREQLEKKNTPKQKKTSHLKKIKYKESEDSAA